MTEQKDPTLIEAIRSALADEMRRDPRVVLFGEGVVYNYRALHDEFGPQRVRDTPIAEAIIAGTAAGAAAMGLRPVIDLLFAPFLMLSMDAIVNSAGKLRYLSGGQFSFPLVVLSLTGAGWGVGGQHNHNVEAMFAQAPGLKVVMPSNPADAHSLLGAAVRDDNPVLYFIDMALAHAAVAPGDGAERSRAVIGRAAVARAGRDVTLVGYGKTVGLCLQAAGQLADHGVSAEVIDLRTLKPLDHATLLASVRHTGRLVVVHEAAGMCGIGAEVVAIASEHAFDALHAPLLRLTRPDAPVPGSWALEHAALPQPDAIAAAARRLIGAAQPVPA